MDAGERAGHVCNHQGGGGDENRADDERSNVASDGGRSRGTLRRHRAKQPKLEVVRQYMNDLKSALDDFTDAVSILSNVLPDKAEKQEYQNHLIRWVEYWEDLFDPNLT